jgi:hypothetical protein
VKTFVINALVADKEKIRKIFKKGLITPQQAGVDVDNLRITDPVRFSALIERTKESSEYLRNEGIDPGKVVLDIEALSRNGFGVKNLGVFIREPDLPQDKWIYIDFDKTGKPGSNVSFFATTRLKIKKVDDNLVFQEQPFVIPRIEK